MSKKVEWDYALRLRGITPESLLMSDLAQYLKEFASLLGSENKPVFEGIVKGSALARSKVTCTHPALVRQRIVQAANDPESSGAPSFRRIQDLLGTHGLSAQVVDVNKCVVIDFPKRQIEIDTEPELLISDTAQLDGQVIYVVGQDDTVHIQLSDVGGRKHAITVTNLNVAKELAKRFRGGVVRVNVHGTWKRNKNGVWEINKVYADSFEDLDERSPLDVFNDLRNVPNNGWAMQIDPIEEWKKIRGIDDLHS